MMNSLLKSVLLLILLISIANGIDTPILDEHACPKDAWVPNGNEFRYVKGRRNPLVPAPTWVGGFAYQYIYRVKLKFGDTIFFKGMSNDLYLFIINFFAGEEPLEPPNIMLHMKVEFQNGRVVFNTCHNNLWDDTEEVGPMLFQRSKPFDLRIHIRPAEYIIVVDGKVLKTYTHRSPIEIVNYIEVRDAPHGITLTRARTGGQEFYMPQVPYNATFPDHRFEFGSRMIVIGLSYGSMGAEFKINFLNAKNDVVMQFHVDFNKKSITCKSLGNEERGNGFWLETGVEFDIDILNRKDGMTMMINGQHYYTFKQYTNDPDKDYAAIRFEGDITLYDINICPNNW